MNLLSIVGVLSTIGSVILALLVLLIMITVHEFGHYIAGKILKFKINEFAIGMGPAIFKKENKKTGELFSIRVFPLGGYCAFEGEDGDKPNEPGAFNNKEPWKRIIVLISGALMNLIAGVLVLILSVGIYGQLLIKTYDIVNEQEPAYAGYSLQNEDVILKVEGNNVFMANDVVDSLKGKKKGDNVKITVLNGGEEQQRVVKLRNDVESSNLTDVYSAFTALGVATIERVDETTDYSTILKGEYLLCLADNQEIKKCTRILTVLDLVSYARGVEVNGDVCFYVLGEKGERLISLKAKDYKGLTDQEVLKELGIATHTPLLKYTTENVKFGFFETLSRGFKYSWNVAGTIFRTLGELLTGKLGVSAMGGPVTTISMTTNAIKNGGFNYFLEIMGFIGINLAVFNLLPFPALDGSRVVFAGIEWIRKKPINHKIEGIIHAVGLIVLLGFCILVDVLQIF